MLVQNANGTSRFSPSNYSSWLEYWENYNEKLQTSVRYNCPACGTPHYRLEFCGAHVRKSNSVDKCLYIVPLCKACTNRTDTFNVPNSLLQSVPSNL